MLVMLFYVRLEMHLTVMRELNLQSFEWGKVSKFNLPSILSSPSHVPTGWVLVLEALLCWCCCSPCCRDLADFKKRRQRKRLEVGD